MTSEQNEPSPEDFESDISPGKVASRATGRPPEEKASEDPEAQAEAILEESESRVGEGFASSEPQD